MVSCTRLMLSLFPDRNIVNRVCLAASPFLSSPSRRAWAAATTAKKYGERLSSSNVTGKALLPEEI